MIMPQPYTSLIPKHIAWYPDVATFARSGMVAPIDNTRPQKLWRDNSPAAPGLYWASLSASARPYSFIARDQNGTPLLTPIDSPDFYRTYSATMAQDAVVRTYREFSFMFTAGVPYLAQGAVTAPNADLNLGSNGITIDYPVELGSNIMLILEGNSVVAYDYQNFLRMAKPPQMPDAERVKLIDQVRQSGMPADQQIKAIRAICTDWHPQVQTT